MIKCNLAIILAERNLKIMKLSKDTGISRTTLTSLYYNHAKGIQFETINTLCNYFRIEPTNLLQYIPIDFLISDIFPFGLNSDGRLLIDCIIVNRNTKLRTQLLGVIAEYKGYKSLTISLHNINNDKKTMQENKHLLNIFNQIPYEFKSIISYNIINSLIDKNILIKQDLSTLVFVWDDDLDIYIEPSNGRLGKGLSAIFGDDIDNYFNNKDPKD